jgi:hypothetical protein
MPLLVRAGQVEIVCVSHVASKSIPSTGLATHLSRHCKNVAVANLPMQHGCIAGEAMILRDNLFIEQVLPKAVLRTLSVEEMAEYRRPFAEPGEGRRPT